MPRELKVDRTIHEALRRYGVKVPGEVGLAAPIQLCSIADDVAHLTEPLNVPIAAAYSFEGAVAVQRGVPVEWEIRSPGGAWIRWATSSVGDLMLIVNAATIIDVAPAALVPEFNTQNMGGAGALQSVCWEGMSTIATIATYGFVIGDTVALDVGVWVARGSFVSLVGLNQNTAVAGSMMIQEVP